MPSYSPTFNRSSTGKFNPNLSFTSIKGGSDAFLLEDEINELQWIQNEARAKLTREMTNSGCLHINGVSNNFVKGGIYLPGNIDLNSFLLYGFSTVVNGYLLNIDNILNLQFVNNSIQLPSPPNVDIRYDFIYLEVWFSELNENQHIHELGGTNNNLATFEFIDTRVNALTSRRVQLQWALRVFDPTLDPSGMGIDRNAYDLGFINSNTNAVNPYTIAMTDHTTPVNGYTFSKSQFDSNLFITGTGSDNDKLVLRTIDGFVYAIPLFFIDRLNSAPYNQFTNPNGGVQYLYNHTSDRPDGKFSDVIYEDQIVDLRSQAYLGKEQYEMLFVTSEQIETINDSITALSAECFLLNDILINDVITTGFETSIGLNSDGTNPGYTSHNYLDDLESIIESISTLDSAIKAVDDKDLDIVDFSTEISTITSVDTAISVLLSVEISTRTNQSATTSTNLSTEGSLRTSVDTTLSTSLSTEVSNRISTDTVISINTSTSLSTEVSNRISADAVISTNTSTSLSIEESTRISVDTILSTTVSDHIGSGNGAHALATTTDNGFMSYLDKVNMGDMQVAINSIIGNINTLNAEVNQNNDELNSLIAWAISLPPPYTYSPRTPLQNYGVDMVFNTIFTPGGFINPDNTINSSGIVVNEPYGVYSNYAVGYLASYNDLNLGKLGEIWIEKSDNKYIFKNSGYASLTVENITFKNDGSTVQCGTQPFNGETGIKIMMPINLTTDFIFISQLECGFADTGEIYILREVDGFTVYNTGSNLNDFEWIVVDTTSTTNTDLTDIALNGMSGVIMAELDYGNSYKILIGPPDQPINNGSMGETLIDKGNGTFTVYTTGSGTASAQCLVFKTPV